MNIVPQPLTREAFAPFGDVIDIPKEAGRTYYEDALGNLRTEAKPSLSLSLKPPTPDRPLKSELMERHEFSSQTFIPVDVANAVVFLASDEARYITGTQQRVDAGGYLKWYDYHV